MIRDLPLHDDWRFLAADERDAHSPEHPDADWSPIVLPHTWNADDMYPGWPAAEAYIGPAWYRRRFRVEPDPAAPRVLLQFDGVANESRVWVNGAFLGGSDQGFLATRLDITEALDGRDEHTLAVRVSNEPFPDRAPPTPIDWERYGGIYRPVHLLQRGTACFAFASIRITTPRVDHDRATLQIECRIHETIRRATPLTIRHEVLDPDGRTVVTLTDTIRTRIGAGNPCAVETQIEAPRLWSPDTPHLYRVRSSLMDGPDTLDHERHPLGFRWIEFDADTGLHVNGEPTKLRGVNVHQDYPGLGIACPERFHRRDIELIKAAGMNFLRGSHYPRDQRQLDACDELGVMVMEEQPFWHGSLRTAGGEGLIEHGIRSMQQMVAQHGNHPSIIAWNTVNEVMLVLRDDEAHPDPTQRKRFHELPRHEWPFARRGIEAMATALREADPTRPTCMVIGGWWRLNVEAGFPDLTDLVAYNGGTMHSEDAGELVIDKLRREHPRWIALMSEGVLNDNAPQRADWPGEMDFWRTCARHWERIYQRPWFCGGAMWVFADYSAKGTYRTRGCVDDARIPYESYRFFQSQWSDEPMVHLCGHWSSMDGDDSARQVVVFSNCPEVAVLLNGRELGPGKRVADEYPHLPRPPVIWSVPWEPGTLKAIGRRDGMQVTDQRVTEGPPRQVVLQAEPEELNAGAQDVSFITARVTDAAGHRCYHAFGPMSLRVGGGASLAGPPTRQVRGGIVGFAIRANGQPNPAQIDAVFDALPPTSLRVRTRPLHQRFPAD